jgi:hypothetical protein
MIKSIFKNIAYSYYPKKIDNINDKVNYLNTSEYEKLSNVLNSFSDYKNSSFYLKLIDEISSLNSFKNIQDVTLLNWEDRCISLEIEILEGNILYKICIHISFLIPYYVIYLLENEVETNPYKWKTIPKHNKKKEKTIFFDKIEALSRIVEKYTCYNRFKVSLSNHIIPDINFQDIEMGEFNFFNAFFLNENKLK